MSITIWILLAVVALMPVARAMAQEPANPPLVAGKEITFTFPDLPQTLHSMIEQTTAVPMATVYLPTDYTPDRQFPLALFIHGAQGSAGDYAGFAREIVGDTGYICLGLPTFKHSLEPLRSDNSNYWMRMMLGPNDAAVIWSSYRTMLARVFEAVPNIDRERSIYGGFSNGAHAAAVLLSNPEYAGPFLSYFRRIILVEGGHRLRPAADLAGTHFLLMRGGANRRDMFGQVKERLADTAANWTEYVMPDVGHDYSPDGKDVTRRWIASLPGPDDAESR